MIRSVSQYTSKAGGLCFAIIENTDVLRSYYARGGMKVIPNWISGFHGSTNATTFCLTFTYN